MQAERRKKEFTFFFSRGADYLGQKVNISERGDVHIVVDGNSLVAGIYLYSLIADGNLVDTKRMVKTE